MTRDIVCDNEVDARKEIFRSWRGGREFLFDSSRCKELFDADPERFMRREEGNVREGTEARRVREAGERAATASKMRARALLSARKGEISRAADAISHALHEASRGLMERQYVETAGLVDRSADRIGSFSERVRDAEDGQVLKEAEDYIRERPALATGAALAAGFVLARFMKSGAGEGAGN